MLKKKSKDTLNSNMVTKIIEQEDQPQSNTIKKEEVEEERVNQIYRNK